MDNPWACIGERVEAVANVAVSVEEIEYLTDFTVYPNPTADVLNVTFTSMEQVAANLEVLNGLGQKVMQVQQNVQVGENRLQMDLSTLSRGIYYLNIWMDGQAVSRKVVVE